ncbi:Dickkopf-related protein 3 [Triplophysa tibetana]|uniref:Dickkopf-related protein 3 n=1 Tax=Triplophysa tibetana TaxID=1572043 RepID=A0A5A9PN85_9TELE|nr:Dickkopf-related protein 3 [Triplophysa tibetana]
MFLLAFCLCLGNVNGIIPETSKTEMDIITNMETNMFREQMRQNEIFKEVEELMEDTQQKLEDAVHQVDKEASKSGSYQHNISSNLQNKSSIEISAGNQSSYSAETTNKMKDNATDEMTLSKGTLYSNKTNNIDYECGIEEDCENGQFCLYETHKSKCLPCKQLDATCTKDEECCAEQLCVWGQCTQNSTKGEAGTSCKYQSDCKEEFCCAVHKALVSPVCSSKPIERERCIITANHLMDLLSQDMEGDGPQKHCPCAGDLQCQHQGRGALCLKSQNFSEEDLADMLYSEVDYVI